MQPTHPVNVVLFQPQIPYNTGNAIRTCAVMGANLHLIRPYGFFLSDKRMRRASADYLGAIALVEHDSFEAFAGSVEAGAAVWLLTKNGAARPDSADFSFASGKPIYLVFGKETDGLPESVLRQYPNGQIRIPMATGGRCLNLSNSVACALYEVYRQNGFRGLK